MKPFQSAIQGVAWLRQNESRTANSGQAAGKRLPLTLDAAYRMGVRMTGPSRNREPMIFVFGLVVRAHNS
jgi:hypothetical protein